MLNHIVVCVAPGGVEPPEAWGTRLLLVPVVEAAEAAGFCGAAAAATVAYAGVAAVNVCYAASEQVGLVLEQHHVHRGFLIIAVSSYYLMITFLPLFT